MNIGEKKKISLYLENHGSDTLVNSNVYFNVEPSEGIILEKSYINVGNVLPGQKRKFEIPIESVSGYNRGLYRIKSECYYDETNSVKNIINVMTSRPILDVSIKMKNYKQFFIFPVPGAAIIKVDIINSGDIPAKNLQIVFPETFINLGILKENTQIIKKIKPNQLKTVEFELHFSGSDLPQKLPLKVVFIEENGYSPAPFYSNLKLINKKNYDIELVKQGQFYQKFQDISEFFITIDASYDEFKKIEGYNELKIKTNNYFPGKIVLGPYKTIEEIYQNFLSFSSQYNQIEAYCINHGKLELVTRYFIKLPNNMKNIENIKANPLLELFTSNLYSQNILVGPFKDYSQLGEVVKYLDQFIDNIVVEKFFPNEVTRYKDEE